MKFIENCKLPAPLRLTRPGKIENSRKGFTLIELIMYMGMLTILIGVLSSIFATTVELQLETKATSAVEQDARFILERLTYDIKRADSITTPTTLGNSSTNLQIVIDGINYSYAINNTTNNLEITTDTNGTDIINGFDTTISNLNFTRLGNTGGKNTIKTSFRITSRIQKKNGFEVKDIDTTIGQR